MKRAVPATAARRVQPALCLYQRRWVYDRSPIKLCVKSRRIGITWATAAEAVIVAGSRVEAGGQDVWYMVNNEDDAREFIDDCGDWAKLVGAITSSVGEVLIEDEDESGGVRNILAFEIRMASGFKIRALSSNPRRLRGKQGLAILDEAAHHDDLDGFLKAATAFLMLGGRIAIVSTHHGVDNPFAKLVEETRRGERQISIHQYTLDDAINDGYYEKVVCLKLRVAPTLEGREAWRAKIVRHYGVHADEELFCVPARSGGVYLPGPLVEACMFRAPVLRLHCGDEFLALPAWERRQHVEVWCAQNLEPVLAALPANRRVFLGQDFGRVSDLTVIAPCYTEPDLTRRFPFLVELRNVPFRQQFEILAYMFGRLPNLARAIIDKGGNGGQIAEDIADDFRHVAVEQLQLSLPWYGEHLPVFRRAFEEQTIAIPRDEDVRNDLTAFQVIDGVPKLPKSKGRGTDQLPRHGDAGIALLLAYSASCEADPLARWVSVA